MQPINPFDTWRGRFQLNAPTASAQNPVGGNTQMDRFVVPTAPRDVSPLVNDLGNQGVPVILPRHLYIPEDAQSVDIVKVCRVSAGTIQEELISFTAPDGALTVFISYGIFNDAASFALTEFIPQVDGQRAYPYHGDPTNNFKIALGSGPDLSLTSLKQGCLILQPGSVVRWLVTNTDTVAHDMGVRMVGYVSSSLLKSATRFGG